MSRKKAEVFAALLGAGLVAEAVVQFASSNELKAASPTRLASPSSEATREAGSGNVAEVLDAHRKELMSLPGVEAIGAGLCPNDPGELCILVYTISGSRPPGLPDQIDGYRVLSRPISSGFRPFGR